MPPILSFPSTVILASSNDPCVAGELFHLDSIIFRFYIISTCVLPLWKTSLHSYTPRCSAYMILFLKQLSE